MQAKKMEFDWKCEIKRVLTSQNFFRLFRKILIEKPNHFFQDTPIPKTFKVKMSEEMTKITIWNTMIITEEYFDY